MPGDPASLAPSLQQKHAYQRYSGKRTMDPMTRIFPGQQRARARKFSCLFSSSALSPNASSCYPAPFSTSRTELARFGHLEAAVEGASEKRKETIGIDSGPSLFCGHIPSPLRSIQRYRARARPLTGRVRDGGKVPLVSAFNGCRTVGLTQSCASQEETGPVYKVDVQTQGFLIQSLDHSVSKHGMPREDQRIHVSCVPASAERTEVTLLRPSRYIEFHHENNPGRISNVSLPTGPSLSFAFFSLSGWLATNRIPRSRIQCGGHPGSVGLSDSSAEESRMTFGIPWIALLGKGSGAGAWPAVLGPLVRNTSEFVLTEPSFNLRFSLSRHPPRGGNQVSGVLPRP